MIIVDEVKHVAKLSRLDLSSAEIKKYQAQLGDILDYVEQLKKVKTDGVETADGGTRELCNIWRSDSKQGDNLPAGRQVNNKQGKDLIKMAPDKDRGQVKVKSVF